MGEFLINECKHFTRPVVSVEGFGCIAVQPYRCATQQKGHRVPTAGNLKRIITYNVSIFKLSQRWRCQILKGTPVVFFLSHGAREERRDCLFCLQQSLAGLLHQYCFYSHTEIYRNKREE
jgi:hypothetical protein